MRAYEIVFRACITGMGLLMLWGCESDGARCVPNSQVTCSCGDGDSIQTCNSAGDAYGPCLCGGDAGPIDIPCSAASDCEDGNPCTTGACEAGNCTFSPTTGPCDDGDDCSTNDLCRGTVCRGEGSCADMDCAADTLHAYLDTATFCMPEAAASDAVGRLSSDYRGFADCVAAPGCTTGCPLTLSTTSVSASYTGPQSVGDSASLDGVVSFDEFTFIFTNGAAGEECEFTVSMTYGTGQSARVAVQHELADGVCVEPASMTTTSFSYEGATANTSYSTRPLPDSSASQADCQSTLDFMANWSNDFARFDEVLARAFVEWAQPNCRDCADGCDDGLRCEMRAAE